MHKFLFYNKFIIYLYMFRALLCSSSVGKNCIIQHLVSSHCRWPSGAPVDRGRSAKHKKKIEYLVSGITLI